MKILDDIWSSVIGNAKVRVNDPFIGTLIASWVVCNWNHLALLLWGEGNASQRISDFHRYLTESNPFELNAVFSIPLILSVFYLFALPWLSLIVNSLQRKANGKLHQQAVDVDLSKVLQQENLNKIKLRSNPDKQFLEQSVQLDIDRKKEILEQTKQRTVRIKERALEATAKAAEAQSKVNILQLEESKRKTQAELEQQRFRISSAENRSTLASHRFPSAYFFMSLIEESTSQDGIKLSLSATSKIVASIFGYKDFDSLIEDEKFNNTTLSKVKYIFYSPDILAKKLDDVVSIEESPDENLTSDLLFDHVRSIFDDLPYKLTTFGDLEEISMEFIENNKYSLLEHESLSGPIAESDTVFEEVNIEEARTSSFENGFNSVIHASASGHHRRESDVAGREISINVEVRSNLQVGKNALGDFTIEKVKAKLADYY